MTLPEIVVLSAIGGIVFSLYAPKYPYTIIYRLVWKVYGKKLKQKWILSRGLA